MRLCGYGLSREKMPLPTVARVTQVKVRRAPGTRMAASFRTPSRTHENPARSRWL